MSRLLFASFILLVMIASAFSQPAGQQTNNSKCGLTLANSPVIRGIQLGMSVEQLLALFSGSAERDDVRNELAEANNHSSFGVARLFFAPSQYPPTVKERFAGIDSVSATLFDKRVVEVTVQYSPPGASSGGVNWRGSEEFIAKLSEAFHLPPPADWDFRSPDSLNCNGFEIVASGDNGGRITLRDGSYPEKVKERRAAEDERRRREFKP